MSDFKKKATIAKDKILGEVKETVGKASGNEALELEGKLQSIKADIKGKINIGDKAEEVKQGISAKINGVIDLNKVKNNKKFSTM